MGGLGGECKRETIEGEKEKDTNNEMKKTRVVWIDIKIYSLSHNHVYAHYKSWWKYFSLLKTSALLGNPKSLRIDIIFLQQVS